MGETSFGRALVWVFAWILFIGSVAWWSLAAQLVCFMSAPCHTGYFDGTVLIFCLPPLAISLALLMFLFRCKLKTSDKGIYYE